MRGHDENDEAPPFEHDHQADPAQTDPPSAPHAPLATARVSKRGACKFCKEIMAAASVWRHQLSCKKNKKRILGRHECKFCGMRFNRFDSYQRHHRKASEMGRCPKRSKPPPLQSIQPYPDSSSTQPPSEGSWLDWSNHQSAQNNQTFQDVFDNLPSAIDDNRQSANQSPMTGYHGSPQSTPPMNAHVGDPQWHTLQADPSPQGDPLASVHTMAWSAELAQDDQMSPCQPSPHQWVPEISSPVTNCEIDYQPQFFGRPQAFSASPPLQTAPPGEYLHYDPEINNINNPPPLQYESHPGAQYSSSSPWPPAASLMPPHSNVHQIVLIPTAPQPPLSGMSHNGLGHPTTPQFYGVTGESNGIYYENAITREGQISGGGMSGWGSHHQSHDTLDGSFPEVRSQWNTTQPPLDVMLSDPSHEMLDRSFPGVGSQWQPTQPPLHSMGYNNPGHSTPSQYDQGTGQYANIIVGAGGGPTPTSNRSMAEWDFHHQSHEMFDRSLPGGSSQAQNQYHHSYW